MHTDLYFRSKVKLYVWSLEAIEPICPEGKFWPNWPYFDTCVRETDVRFEISASNYPRDHRNSKKKRPWRHQRSLTSNDLGWPQEGHEVSANHDFHLVTTIDMHIADQNTELLKLQVSKRCGTQTPLDMTLRMTSQVIGGRVTKFPGKMSNWLLVTLAKFGGATRRRFLVIAKIRRGRFGPPPRTGEG